MSNIITEALSFVFFQRALMIGGIIAIIYSLLGCFVVIRKETIISHSISNFAFLGVALGMLLNSNINLFIFAAALAGALIIGLLQNSQRFARDSILTFSSESSIAIAIILISFLQGYRVDILQFLFGNILAISSWDLLTTSIIGLVTILFLLFWGRKLLQTILSGELAKASQTNVKLVNSLFVGLLALAIAVGVKTIGIILIAAFLVIPANSAKLIAGNFKQMLVLSTVYGLLGTIFGLFFSYIFDLPSGATIVTIMSIMLITTLGLQTLIRRINS